jgi:hypothetical protein
VTAGAGTSTKRGHFLHKSLRKLQFCRNFYVFMQEFQSRTVFTTAEAGPGQERMMTVAQQLPKIQLALVVTCL